MIAYALLTRYDDYEHENKYEIIETTEELDEPWVRTPHCPEFTSRDHALMMLKALREKALENRRPVMDGGGLSGAN